MKKVVVLFIVVLLTTCQWAFGAITKPVEQNGWLEVSPSSIGYPEYTKPGVEKQYTVTVRNPFDSILLVLAIAPYEDSAKPSAPSGWLGISGTFTEIPAHDSRNLTLELNNGGVVMSSHPTRLYGRVVFTLQLMGEVATEQGTLPINFTVCDTIVFPVWDTVVTTCAMPLTIGSNGNLGAHGIGGANLNFPQPSPECDTGENNPGNAAVYLFDASPVVLRKVGDSVVGSWSVYDGDISSPNGFKPLFPSSNRGYFSAARWEGYNTGTFCTADSLVKVERTVYAPAGTFNADSCHFVIMRTRYYPYMISSSVNGLAIGDVFDFDIPSDSGGIGNVGGVDASRRLVYARGYKSGSVGTACYDNSFRYAGAALLAYNTRSCAGDTMLYGGYNAANDSFIYPAGRFDAEQLWASMQTMGYSTESRITDLHSVLTYTNGSSDQGFTLPANDTLTVWTAIAVVRPAGGTSAQALDSLKREIDKARRWWRNFCVCCFSCCYFKTGNIATHPWEIPNLTDLSYLIAYLTTEPRPVLGCMHEANVNGSGGIDLSDLSLLIAYFIETPRPELPYCPL
ncbi:MAG: hypothetical protein IPH75_08700 [bacterium]|nr:hypothetical protein [bacterium]